MRPYRRKPPWHPGRKARTEQLECEPRSYRRAWQADGRPTWAEELAWAAGPQSLGVTGDGSYPVLYGSHWLVSLCADGDWFLYQRTATDALTRVSWDVAPPRIGPSARHVTLAFDQAARPAVAWEDADAITLRQFDEQANAYAFTGPYAGVDPILWADATVNGMVPGSDVILFYLSTDRLTLHYRIQAENYDTEHDLYSFAQPAVLDGIELLMLRYQAKYGLSDEGGARDIEGGAAMALLSDFYPYEGTDELTAGLGSLEDGSYALVVKVIDPTQEDVTGVLGALQDGHYEAVVIVRDPAQEDVTGAVGSLQGGAYTLVVVVRDPVQEDATGSVGPLQDGTYLLVVIVRDPAQEDVTGSMGSLGDGTYAAV